MVKVVRVGERGSEGRRGGRLDDLILSPACMMKMMIKLSFKIQISALQR